MSEAATERRLAAIILGDVVGYSRIMGTDEEGTMAALKAHRQHLILPALAAYRARLVDAAGDSMLMEFGSAVSAVSCAVTIQRGMLSRNADVPSESRLCFRLGINLGDIMVDGNQIFGDGVNVAARLEGLCEPGGICLSRSIYEQIRGRLPFPFVDEGEQALKNIAHPVQVYRLPADFIATLPEPSFPEIPPPAPTIIRDLKPGTMLNDTYQIDAVMLSGGMGEVFRGHEIHSGGGVAIKVVRPDMMDNKVAAALFQKEALTLKDITHDAVVRYYSFSFDPVLRRHYLAMEFVDGPSLPELLKEGPLSVDAVSRLRRRVASGLHVAHERAIVHRDVSSDNIILPLRDVARAKIIDFGIARSADIGGATIIGDGFAGKLAYASPEHFGLAGGTVTPLSDIYSFGLVLAEASLGRPLNMGGTQAEVLDKRRVVPDLGAVDPRLRPLLERMLQPDPAQRPASMQEVAEWPLEADVSQAALAATRLSGPPRSATASATAVVPRPPQGALSSDPPARPLRSVERWILGAALAVALLGGLAFGAYEMLSRPARTFAVSTSVPVETPPKTDVPAHVPDPPPPTPPVPTPPVPTPPPPKPPVASDRIANYVKAYDGGPCFLALLTGVSDRSAAIDSFAEARDAFRAFDAAFARDLGFPPMLVGHRIWSKQCAVLDFLRQTSGAGAPDLLLKSTSVARGQSLAGEIRGAAKTVALLLVQEDGVVVDQSAALKGDGDGRTFDMAVAHGAAAGPMPQLLVTIASAQPLQALSQPGPQSAAGLFPQLLSEAKERGGLAASARLFLVTP